MGKKGKTVWGQDKWKTPDRLNPRQQRYKDRISGKQVDLSAGKTPDNGRPPEDLPPEEMKATRILAWLYDACGEAIGYNPESVGSVDTHDDFHPNKTVMKGLTRYLGSCDDLCKATVVSMLEELGVGALVKELEKSGSSPKDAYEILNERILEEGRSGSLTSELSGYG